MQVNKLSDTWLFERHTKQTLREWLRPLRYFYFKRAWGGHANDGDEFQTAFSFTDRSDLINKVKQLGLPINALPDDLPRLVDGQAYSENEFKAFKNEIKSYEGLEQPGHTTIFGHKVFIWVYGQSIQITVSGTADNDPYEVTEADFKVCLALEKEFDNLNWKSIIDKSLEDSVCCISRKKYPELYNEVNL